MLGGQSSQFGDAMTSLVFALLIGILVAYMVLASQFNSFLHPVTVLTILPLSVAGAMFALFVAGKTLNVFSMIGLLLLMGIVKKNSIILVDYANEVREKEHLDARTAMLAPGPVRLRPILMTAVATLMAAVPSALGLGPGRRDARPDGRRGHRRAHPLDGAEPARRAGVLRGRRPLARAGARTPVSVAPQAHVEPSLP